MTIHDALVDTCARAAAVVRLGSMATRDGDGVTRYDRYQALKTCVRRLGLHSLGDNPSKRAMKRGAGAGEAWDRVGRLIYPCPGDYPIRREVTA